MLADDTRAALEAAWTPARAAGVLGSASIETLWEHTAGFASAVCSSFSAPAETLTLELIDVGTGAGVPGLLLAAQLPCVHVTLLDASERRLDHVRRAARALGVVDRVTVVHGRADVVAHDPAYRGRFDAAMARLLADPSEALELLVGFVRDRGVLVVSAAAEAIPRWEALPVAGVPTAGADVTRRGDDWFVTVERRGDVPATLPRRSQLRRRRPLLPG